MPFPFDSEQSIGILSNAFARIDGEPMERLPFVPEQDKQWDPPPPPPPDLDIESWAGLGKFSSIYPDRRLNFQGLPRGLDPRDYGSDTDGPYVSPVQDYTDPNPKQPTKKIVKDPRTHGISQSTLKDLFEINYNLFRSFLDPASLTTGKNVERLTNALVTLGLLLQKKWVVDWFNKMTEDCPEMTDLLNCLQNKPWKNKPIQVLGNGLKTGGILGVDPGTGFFIYEDIFGNKVTVDPDTTLGEYEPSDGGYLIIDMNLIDSNALSKGLSKETYLERTLFHELVHRCGGGEIEAFYLTNELYGKEYGDKFRSFLGEGTEAQMKKQDEKTRGLNDGYMTFGDNMYYSNFMAYDKNDKKFKCRNTYGDPYNM